MKQEYELYKSRHLKYKTKYNILIVDDDVYLSNILKLILDERGHQVDTTTDEIECISKCMNKKYDIIFIDYHMNIMTGVEVTSVLKNVCSNDSKIFVFTEDNSNKAISEFKKCKMNGAIMKPINTNIITKIIDLMEKENKLNKKYVLEFDTDIKRQVFIF
jgi:CheY-like chemotaxis protein